MQNGYDKLRSNSLWVLKKQQKCKVLVKTVENGCVSFETEWPVRRKKISTTEFLELFDKMEL